MHNYKIYISWDMSILGHLQKGCRVSLENFFGYLTSELKFINDEVLLGHSYNYVAHFNV